MSGLLGGTAGQIDVTTLISQLMQAAALPQTQLKDQLTAKTTQLTTYQTINTKLASLLAAGQKLTDNNTWAARSATSSSSSVVATSTAGAPLGTATFSVKSVAQAQVSIVTADPSGDVVSDPTQGITINGTNVALTSGSASDVAAAINQAGLGVTANVVNADGGQKILQLTSTKTGTAGAFTTGNGDGTGDFEAGALSTIVDAQDAKVQVGSDTAGYTVTNSTNSFTDVIPGVTFSVSAPADNVSITVDNDEQAVSDAVKALVTAANTATGEINTDTAQGAVFAANPSVSSIAQSILRAVSSGTSTGGSLSTYGISIDSNGVMSFDATAFASAYNADPAGTQTAINGFAASLDSTATDATSPTYGSITTAIQECTSTASRINDEIGTWDDRLATIKSQYTSKFTAMETALAKLQSQQTYLTSMFNSINKSSSDSSS
jgi:flagellar hook-associated protein 2